MFSLTIIVFHISSAVQNCSVNLLSVCDGRVWDLDDLLAECVDGVSVNMMYPLIGRLPDDNSDPESKVGGHQVDETEPGKQPKPLNNHGRVDKEEVHL